MSRRGWLLFIALSVIWGLPYLFIRVAVRSIDPGTLVWWRTMPATLILWPVVIARGHAHFVRRHLGWIAAFAVIEFGVPWYLMSKSEEHISSSLTSLLVCTVPLFSVVAQRIRRTEEPVSGRRLVGLALGGLGVAGLVGLDMGGSSLRWLIYMLLVCVGYTIGPIILATRLSDVPGLAVVAGATSVVALGWTPWALTHLTRAPASGWFSVAVLSTVCTAGAFLTFFELIKEVGSTRSVVVTYVNTAIAVVLGVSILHESLTAGIAVGFPLVIVGSILATSSAKRPATDSPLVLD